MSQPTFNQDFHSYGLRDGNPDHIIAFADIQGYSFEYPHVFFPREYAFVCDYFTKVYEVDSIKEQEKYKSKFPVPERDIERQLEHHGIPREPFSALGLSQFKRARPDVIKLADLPTINKRLWVLAKQYKVKECGEGNYTLAFKDQYLPKLIEISEIPYFGIGWPTLYGKSTPQQDQCDKCNTSYYCQLHGCLDAPSTAYCAVKKATTLWNFIKNAQNEYKVDKAMEAFEVTHVPENALKLPSAWDVDAFFNLKPGDY